MPSTATDRLDGLTTSVAVKAPCKAYTSSTITQSGEQTIGGVACVDGDRYLYDVGTSAAGIWVVRKGAHERAKDFDGNRDVVQGTMVLIATAAANANIYRVTTANPIVIGTTAIDFELAGLGDAAAVNFTQTGTSPTTRTMLDKARDVFHIDDYGAAGDGATDDSTKIINAANEASAQGVELVLNGAKTYALGSEITFPVGLRLKTNGATFTTALTTTGDTYLITVGDDTVIDELIVNIPTGKRRDRCVLFDGDDIRVGSVTVTSVDQQANTAAADGAVQVLTGARNSFGLIRVSKWDRSVVIASTAGCTVQRIEATNYVRALYLYDNNDLQINSGEVKTASPNASGSAGHNGVLMGCNSTDAQRDVTIRDFAVENAGEHGWRVGGPERQSKLKFLGCSACSCGGNGFKVLGTDSGTPTARNASIVIDNFVAEDVGTDASIGAPNRAGLYLAFVDDVQVAAPIVRPRDNATSAQYGMHINACADVFVTTPILRAANFDGLLLNAADGDNTNIQVNGGEARGCLRHGLNVLTAAAMITGRCLVDGFNSVANSNLGFNIDNSGTMSENLFRLKTYGNTNGMGACNNTPGTTLQISGAPGSTAISGISARNGSWIDDTTTLNIRKAGSWTAL